jgi:hypothetical protein
MIYYKVAGRGQAELNNFAGTSVYQLKKAIKAEEELPHPASLLKLFVKKFGGVRKDLDELEAEWVESYMKAQILAKRDAQMSDEVDSQMLGMEGDKMFVLNFKTLCDEYLIGIFNPIFVELPSK